MIEVLDDIQDLTWLKETYPFTQDDKPTVIAILWRKWIACYERNNYKCIPRVWCLHGHKVEPVVEDDCWLPPKECPQCVLES